MELISGFFDTNANDLSCKLWTRPKKDFKINQSDVKIAFLGYKKNKNNQDEIVLRYFSIIKDFLCYKKNIESNKTSGLMDLKWSRVTLSNLIVDIGGEIGEKELCEITITRNLKYFKLYVDYSEPYIHKILAILTKICILTNFKNEYKIIDIYDRGSFGTVFKAKNMLNGVEYAVKRVSKLKINGEMKDTEPLRREINALRLFNHKNIVELSEIHEAENSIYLIFEKIEGGIISNLDTSKIKIEEIRNIIYSILEALEHIEDNGIVHRDIKPSNIMKTKKGEIKLIDFGLSIERYQVPSAISGTPGFMAPELFSINQDTRHLMNSKVDIFSLAVVLHFLLFGKLIFKGKNAKDLIENNQKRRISICEVAQMITDVHSTEAFDLMKKMIIFDQNERISVKEAKKHPFFC